ncbi:MAG: hypothetical protein JWO36_6818 [Myxococcales bacterium]|nr:hypothetical protein [Myxococcales bacterium]
MRGVAVFYGEAGATAGTIENLSRTGALINVTGIPTDRALHVELKLGIDSGWVGAHPLRVETIGRGPGAPRDFRIAVRFERVDDDVQYAIDAAISSALRAAQQRPILVIDEQSARRRDLTNQLARHGMTPLAPRTPLEAIDLLTRTQLHVNVCLIAPSFGQTTAQLRALVEGSFPWVMIAEISDDITETVARAADAWSGTDVARIATS